MSRGPGKHQRAILEQVGEHDHLFVTAPGKSNAYNTAARRAAYSLEKAGKIELTVEYWDGVRRLVAHRPGTDHVEVRWVQGSDGKLYRGEMGSAVCPRGRDSHGPDCAHLPHA